MTAFMNKYTIEQIRRARTSDDGKSLADVCLDWIEMLASGRWTDSIGIIYLSAGNEQDETTRRWLRGTLIRLTNQGVMLYQA